MYTYKCKIRSIVDGDTIDIELDLGFDIIMRERVRLIGVNTPEVYGQKASTEGAAGRIASEFTRQWFADRSSRGYFVYESLKYDARDKYGRCLGRISWVDNDYKESLNEALQLKGW